MKNEGLDMTAGALCSWSYTSDLCRPECRYLGAREELVKKIYERMVVNR